MPEIVESVDKPEDYYGIDLDGVLSELGEFGKFQKIIYFLTFLPVILDSCLCMSYIFTTAQVDYRCKIPECDKNVTEYAPIWLENAVPYRHNEPEKCIRYSTKMYSNSSNRQCSLDEFDNTKRMKCDEFVYRTNEVTILNEFNLTCRENEWKLTLIGTIKNTAELIMLPISGMLSDRFGRRTMLICAFSLTGTLGILISFSWNYWMFASLEFATALLTSGSYMSVFILGMELVGKNKRVLGGAVISMIFSFGQIFLGVAAMYAMNFRILLRILYSLALVTVSYIWVIPESFRWLLSKGRNKEAVQILFKAAKVNKVELSSSTVHALNKCAESNGTNLPTQSKSLSVLSIRSKRLFLRLLNCCFCWFTMGFVYYGLSVQSVALGGNKFANFIWISVSEVPACIISYYLMDRAGRKITLAITMILAGISCFAYEFIPAEAIFLRIFMFFISKCAISISFSVTYVYTTELFPTNLRQGLMGICAACGYIGSMTAPQTPLLARLMPSLPVILFGGISMLSGSLVLFLPETFNTNLPDTIAEAKNIGRTKHKETVT